jgi:dihydroorotase
VNPPLRSEADREALISGLLDGTVDAIATDHAPHTAADKAAGAPGFSGIQLAFAVCNTALVRTGRLSLSRLSALMSANPASILRLDRGLLREGFDADLVLVDPSLEFIVDPSAEDSWFSKGRYTPFAGARLSGVVLSTFRAGHRVFPA